MADTSNKFTKPSSGLSDDGDEPEVGGEVVSNSELKEMLDDITGKLNVLTDLVGEVKKGQTSSGDAIQTLRKDIEDHVTVPSSSSGDGKKVNKAKADGPFALDFAINQFKAKKDGIDLNGPTVSKALFLICRFVQHGYTQAPKALGEVIEWCFFKEAKLDRCDYKAQAERRLEELKAKGATQDEVTKAQDAVYAIISIHEKVTAITNAFIEVSTVKEVNPTSGAVKDATQKIKDALANNIEPYTQTFIRNLGSLFQVVAGTPKLGAVNIRNQPVKAKFKDTFLCAAWAQRLSRDKQGMFGQAYLAPGITVPSVEPYLDSIKPAKKVAQ